MSTQPPYTPREEVLIAGARQQGAHGALRIVEALAGVGAGMAVIRAAVIAHIQQLSVEHGRSICAFDDAQVEAEP